MRTGKQHRLIDRLPAHRTAATLRRAVLFRVPLYPAAPPALDIAASRLVGEIGSSALFRLAPRGASTSTKTLYFAAPEDFRANRGNTAGPGGRRSDAVEWWWWCCRYQGRAHADGTRQKVRPFRAYEGRASGGYLERRLRLRTGSGRGGTVLCDLVAPAI